MIHGMQSKISACLSVISGCLQSTSHSGRSCLMFQTLGGIPWNTYMMRLLSAKSVRHAQVISIAGGLVSLSLAVPPVLLGIVGVSTSKFAFERPSKCIYVQYFR